MTSDTDKLQFNLDDLLNRHFAGRVVRKDLTKLVKEGANVPVYVLEYLLGSYCASNDEAVIEDGLKTVKKILAENYVRPDEAEKVKSTIRERGSLKVIDKISVTLNEKRDVYEALLANLGVKGVEVTSSTSAALRAPAAGLHNRLRSSRAPLRPDVSTLSPLVQQSDRLLQTLGCGIIKGAQEVSSLSFRCFSLCLGTVPAGFLQAVRMKWSAGGWHHKRSPRGTQRGSLGAPQACKGTRPPSLQPPPGSEGQKLARSLGAMRFTVQSSSEEWQRHPAAAGQRHPAAAGQRLEAAATLAVLG